MAVASSDFLLYHTVCTYFSLANSVVPSGLYDTVLVSTFPYKSSLLLFFIVCFYLCFPYLHIVIFLKVALCFIV